MTKIKKDKNLPAVAPTQEIAIAPEQSPITIMQMAMNKNLDLERVEKMLELQERYEKNEAKKAYNVAMSKFKENPPKENWSGLVYIHEK